MLGPIINDPFVLRSTQFVLKTTYLVIKVGTQFCNKKYLICTISGGSKIIHGRPPTFSNGGFLVDLYIAKFGGGEGRRVPGGVSKSATDDDTSTTRMLN